MVVVNLQYATWVRPTAETPDHVHSYDRDFSDSLEMLEVEFAWGKRAPRAAHVLEVTKVLFLIPKDIDQMFQCRVISALVFGFRFHQHNLCHTRGGSFTFAILDFSFCWVSWHPPAIFT